MLLAIGLLLLSLFGVLTLYAASNIYMPFDVSIRYGLQLVRLAGRDAAALCGTRRHSAGRRD